MLEWLNDLSQWLQTWISAPAGLWALFASAFLSATVLPGSSEVVLAGLITAFPAQAWPGFWVALAGNLLGCVLTYGMGWAAREGFARFKRMQVPRESVHMARLKRFGPPALVLSFLPLAGDALVLAAGWLKLDPLRSLFFIAIGKGARYLVVVLGMLGVLSFN